MTSEGITLMAAALSEAHLKYRNAFGQEPHGTAKQYAALLEFCPQAREAIRLWDQQRIEKETV